jgi:flagellar export protein FliJ
MPPEFSLQTVLDYRHSRVETLEVELGRMVAEQQQLLSARAALLAEQRSTLDELRRRQAGTLDLAAITQSRIHLRRLEQHIAQHTTALNTLAGAIDEQRARLVTARQEEETLATLRDKEQERWHDEQKRAEERMRDDLYIARAHRRAMA